MLTKWVVETYKTLVEVALWAFIIIGGIVGASAGNLAGHGFLGCIIGAATCFFGMAIFFGAALILQDIHERVKGIESHLSISKDGSGFSESNIGIKRTTNLSENQQKNSMTHTNKPEIKCTNCGALYSGQRAGSLCKCGKKLI